MRFLAGLLFSALAASWAGPGNAPVIDTGSGSRPVLGATAYTVQAGNEAFTIATRGARALKIHQLGRASDISCEGRPILDNSWYRIPKTVTCSIMASEKNSLELYLLDQATATVLKLPQGKYDWEVSVPDGAPLLTATVLVQPALGPGSSGGQAPSGQALPNPEQKHASWLPWLIAVLVFGAGVAVMYLISTGKLRSFAGGGSIPPRPVTPDVKPSYASQPSAPVARRSLPDPPISPATSSPISTPTSTRLAAPSPTIGAEMPAPSVSLPPSSSSPSTEQIAALRGEVKELAQTIEHFSQGIERLSQDLEFVKTRIGQFASQQGLAEAEETIRREVKQVADKISGMPTPERLTRQFGLLHQEVNAFEEKLAKQEEIIKKLSAGASEKLAALLKVLPEDYLRAAAGQDAAKLLDQAVSDFFVQSVPARDGLKQCKERARAFAGSIDRLLSGLSSDYPEIEERMSPLLDQARRVQEEAEDLLSAAASRMRLRFDVEFYASKANRERLIDGIASGLKKQIVRIAKPMEYFDHRLLSLAAATAQAASDFLDANVDPQRGNARVQGLLKDLLGAGGLEQIAPAPNEEFRAAEHAVVQMVPRPGGPGGTPSVARLVARGFRRDKEVLRKASVILYE